MTNINDWQPCRDKVARLANSLCQREKKVTMAPLSDGIGDERNEDFGAVSIPQCLSHAFYTRSKCHLWYNTALWVGAHHLLFGRISGYSVYKFNRNQVKLLKSVSWAQCWEGTWGYLSVLNLRMFSLHPSMCILLTAGNYYYFCLSSPLLSSPFLSSPGCELRVASWRRRARRQMTSDPPCRLSSTTPTPSTLSGSSNCLGWSPWRRHLCPVRRSLTVEPC